MCHPANQERRDKLLVTLEVIEFDVFGLSGFVKEGTAPKNHEIRDSWNTRQGPPGRGIKRSEEGGGGLNERVNHKGVWFNPPPPLLPSPPLQTTMVGFKPPLEPARPPSPHPSTGFEPHFETNGGLRQTPLERGLVWSPKNKGGWF